MEILIARECCTARASTEQGITPDSLVWSKGRTHLAESDERHACHRAGEDRESSGR
jgi:hypothetical protein